MSQKETWRTRKYWSQTGGLLIEEFLAVNGSKTVGRRPIDGVIVLNEETRVHDGNFYDIEGKDVIVIQTKSNRIGMYLLGQAYFSQFLINKFNPRSIKSIAICGKYDDVIGQLAKDHGIEVVVISESEYEEKFDDPAYIRNNRTFNKT
ncbi:MAG: hypothetical protein HKP45_09470 [Winogradskyella sp.]|nr:hypothetical protein [Winogradskyella sp.]